MIKGLFSLRLELDKVLQSAKYEKLVFEGKNKNKKELIKI